MRFIVKETFIALAEFASIVGLVAALIWMFLL